MQVNLGFPQILLDIDAPLDELLRIWHEVTPTEPFIKENIDEILKADLPSDEKAIRLCLYCMRTQIFNDGNKRASVIFSNHYLISQGGGMLIIPEKNVPEFKMLLVAYYESNDSEEIVRFMKKQCIKTF